MPPSLQPRTGLISSSPSLLPRAPTPRHHPASLPRQQVRHATLIRRPHRPYTFTQLLALSDGSTFLHRTTSPTPVYRSTRDTRNSPAWNPSNARLANIEEDEAGRLRAFRRRFGRAFDAAAPAADAAPTAQDLDRAVPGSEAGAPAAEKTQDEVSPRGAGSGTTARSESAAAADEDEDENLMDLLGSYGDAGAQKGQGGAAARIVQRSTAAAAAASGKGGRKRR